MARGVRKPIEEKIREKQTLIQALETRLEKENELLDALLREEREQRLEVLSEFLTEANLSPEEATEILRRQLLQKDEYVA